MSKRVNDGPKNAARNQENQRKDLIVASVGLILFIGIVWFIIGDDFKTTPSQSQTVKQEDPTAQKKKEQALYKLLKKQGRLPSDWTPEKNKRKRQQKSQRVIKPNAEQVSQKKLPPANQKGIRPSYKRPPYRSWYERKFRQAFLQEKYALVLHKYPHLRDDLWKSFALFLKKTPNLKPEVYIQKNLDSKYKNDLVTQGNRDAVLLSLDTKNKQTLSALTYEQLKAICVEHGGAYQGQRKYKGWKYFISNCFCSRQGRSMKHLNWIHPYLFYLGCE